MNARRISRGSITAAGVLLIAACHDNPVALNESEHPPPFSAVPMERAASGGGSSSVSTVVDHTRPRFKIDFSVTGAMTPNASVTVTLLGQAVEKVASGGTVTVTLPTMAGATHAGAGKRPYYPIGQSFPVTGNWTLSAMEPGDTWQRSFAVTLPPKGYYHLSVSVDTEAPAGELSNPYVNDDVHFERWMLVTDTGGRLTLDFDDSVFATGVAPMPGPFINKIGQRGASQAAAADAVMDSDDYVYMSVTYVDKNRDLAAVGAYAHAAQWHDHDHTDGPWNQQAAYVSSSGVIAFTCPPTGYHLEGAVDLPSTAHIAGSGFSGYWEAGPSDCGDTISAAGPRKKYLPWKHLKEVVPKIRSHFGNPSVPRVAWFTSSTDSVSSYNSSLHRIKFGFASYHYRWTAAHEYAHAVHAKGLGGLWTVESSCSNHEIWKVSGYRCAFLEGFADYAADIAHWGHSSEYAPSDAPDADPRIEGYIAMLFRDLIDSTNEDDDETTYSASSVGTAFKSCRVKFTGPWRKRNNVSDFVWCMENRINSGVHNDHFPGLTAPTKQTASRGSGWDADDIRSTWLQNLTDN